MNRRTVSRRVIVIHVFAAIFHGAPSSKVKRECSPSPCRTPHADPCLYSYRYKASVLPLSGGLRCGFCIFS